MEKNIFPTTEEEAQRAANELYEIKVQIKELLTKLSQIEKRLKVISPSIQIKKTQPAKGHPKQNFTEDQLRHRYENLLVQFNEDPSKTINQMSSMDRNELEALVRFLGVSFAQKPSQKKLVDMALGRLKESKLLRNDRK